MEIIRNFNLKNKKPDIRYLKEMKKVVYDQKWFENASPDIELYYMYRGIKEENNLRYDITIIPAKKLGKEFIKTKGHYHLGNFGEIYIVLKGKAIYLLQRRGEDNFTISDVYYIEAKKNEIAVIPPQYGHITINPSEEDELIIANWVSKDCKSDYLPIEEAGGACYFYTQDGWVKNKNYKLVPKLYSQKPRKVFPINLNFLNG